MKNQLLSLSACILFSIHVSAQSGPHVHEQMYLNYISHAKAMNDVDFDKQTMYKMANAGVRIVQKRKIQGKGKTTETRFILNAAGRPLEVHAENREMTYTYVDDTLLSGIRYGGKQQYEARSMYTEGRLCHWETRRKDRITYRLLLQYDKAGNVRFSMMQRGWKLRKNFTLENVYSGSKLAEQRFMYNDKLIREWDYSCAPEGEEKGSKRIVEVCKSREENADGSYIEHVRKMENGKIVLFKHFYSEKEVLLKTEKYREDGSLESRWEYTNDGNVYEEISAKGVCTQRRVTQIDANGNTLLKRIDMGKKHTEIRYTYNEANLLRSKEERLNGKRIVLEEYSYE